MIFVALFSFFANVFKSLIFYHILDSRTTTNILKQFNIRAISPPYKSFPSHLKYIQLISFFEIVYLWTPSFIGRRSNLSFRITNFDDVFSNWGKKYSSIIFPPPTHISFLSQLYIFESTTVWWLSSIVFLATKLIS
jgi:hypothetical protein